jgi:dipeptidyl aminopeptidase/acylaminoacyl peptidase
MTKRGPGLRRRQPGGKAAPAAAAREQQIGTPGRAAPAGQPGPEAPAGTGGAAAAEGEPGQASPPQALQEGGAGPDEEASPAAAPLPVLPHGSWPSPISAADVARGGLRISYPTVAGDDIWWQEVRPDEGGRTTIMHRKANGDPVSLLGAPWNARTRVHEYGGLSYLPVPRAALRPGSRARGQAIVFAHFADQRLYALDPAGDREPRAITPDPAGTGGPGPAALRYADFVLSPDRKEIWCVREAHAGGKVSRAIVAIPLDGSAADSGQAVRQLVSGADFFAFPTPSPGGTHLAWISWNHPHMPWDGTELRVAPIAKGVPGKGRLIKGSIRESVLAPVWRDNTSLYVITDWTGWWNIYQLGLRGEPAQALYPADEEFAGPLWQLGGRPLVMLADGRLAVVHGRGGLRLAVLDPETCELTDLDTGFTDFRAQLSADGSTVAAIVASATAPYSVARIEVPPAGEAEPAGAGAGRSVAATVAVLRQEISQIPEAGYLPVPEHAELEGPFGRVVHALVYPPASPAARGPDGELPPYVVWVHGGPTGHVTAVFDLEKAYFTSRGIGVIDVNYGGSTGYGRSYRERLRRQWGIVDVEDAMAAARSLADAGRADRARLAIRGGSAGGWTALAAVTTGAIVHGPVFSAAVSYFGVADLRAFPEHTHDFESRYLDGLVGPLPGFDAVYAERAPVGHVSDATCPILLLQGLDDPIVPPAQSEAMAADLAAHGIRHAYLAFAGESHGFRKAETVIASLEAELSFYGQVFGFEPPGIPKLRLTSGEPRGAAAQRRSR